jgi:hypothetical protein
MRQERLSSVLLRLRFYSMTDDGLVASVYVWPVSHLVELCPVLE